MLISGTPPWKGLTANPAMVAADFVASEPVEKDGEVRQRGTDRRGVAVVVVAADCQSEVIERGQRVAVFGLESGQTGRQEGLVARLPLSWAITTPRRRASRAR